MSPYRKKKFLGAGYQEVFENESNKRYSRTGAGECWFSFSRYLDFNISMRMRGQPSAYVRFEARGHPL